MAWDYFIIAPLNSGLQTDVRPFLIPDDAFASFSNAYNFRSRVRKRFGGVLLQGTTKPTPGYEQLQSRLRINLGNTPSANLPGGMSQLQPGQMFSVGDRIFTVWQLGAGVITLSTDGAVTCTIDSTASPNTVTFAGAPAATPIYYYPSTPVMGLAVLENAATNDETLVAFDTQFAYQYTATGFERLNSEAVAGDSVWSGSNSQFFWTTNYRGDNAYNNILYVTNFNAAETRNMRYLNGTQWNQFRPQLNSGAPSRFLDSARIILPFKKRLVCLNTVEYDGAAQRSYPQRARYSQVGSPLAAGGLATTSWIDDAPGRGNAIDAATSEAIKSAEFVKDRLIVYFERSTWELAYTGNEAQPFTWQKINTELGAESTFSIVPFDKVAIGVGNVGIHACNGGNVERIDVKIPQVVFDIHNDNDGVERVYGIRDFYNEMVYWSFPDVTRTSTSPFNNKILAFNYTNQSWAFFDDSITCFGYFQQQYVSGATWEQISAEWQVETDTWAAAPLQAKFRNVIAGNQEGFVFIVDNEESQNCPALQITDVLSTAPVELRVIDHNLVEGEYILIESMQGATTINGQILQVEEVIDADSFTFNGDVTLTGTYTGGGVITRVSQIDILTKQYNFYLSQGRNAYIPKVEVLVDRTSGGEISIDYFTSSANLGLVDEAQASGSLLGTGIVGTSPYVPYENSQARLWHDTFMNAEGECIQLRIYLSHEQMTNNVIALSGFTLHALAFHAQPTYPI